MEEIVASRIVKAAVSLDEALGYLDAAVANIPDDLERKEFSKKLGDIVGKVNDVFIRSLVKQYPHLEPDR